MVGARGDEDYLAFLRDVGFEHATALQDATTSSSAAALSDIVR